MGWWGNRGIIPLFMQKSNRAELTKWWGGGLTNIVRKSICLATRFNRSRIGLNNSKAKRPMKLIVGSMTTSTSLSYDADFVHGIAPTLTKNETTFVDV